MKYPQILFYRYSKYSDVDSQIKDAEKQLDCTIEITDNPEDINKLFDPNYPILVTYGPNESEYYDVIYKTITQNMRKRWVHYKEFNPAEFSRGVNYCYIHNSIGPRENIRPIFSIFTTCYNSYDKINRAFNSIQNQTMTDWEWVILDDSPDDAHFIFLRDKFKDNKKIRLYKRAENSGNIGNVKNEAISLCRGKYILEMDHDDEILLHTLKDATTVFDKDPEVGFVYMDFINIYENGNNFSYGDFISYGYGGYYYEYYEGHWRPVYISPQINNITMTFLVAMPNHPRIWRTSVLKETLGSYSEFLPICDDQEILLRTCLHTKMVKIPKLSYVQYMNDNNNNFSLIRNSEINRLGPKFIFPQFYNMYELNDFFKANNAFDDEKYRAKPEKLWKRPPDFQPNYMSQLIQLDYEKQYCIIGTDLLKTNPMKLYKLYINKRHDFIILDNEIELSELFKILVECGFERMKCHSMKDCTKDELELFFHRMYRSCTDYEILY